MNINEFEKHWKVFSTTIESLLIKQLRAGRPNISFINEEIKTSVKKWNQDSAIEGVWYNELKENNPEKASKFIQQINSVELKSTPYKKPSIFGNYIIITLIGLMGLICSIYFEAVWWKQILICIVSILMASTVILPIGQKKINKYNDNVVAEYMLQISDYKNRLIDILSK